MPYVGVLRVLVCLVCAATLRSNTFVRGVVAWPGRGGDHPQGHIKGALAHWLETNGVATRHLNFSDDLDSSGDVHAREAIQEGSTALSIPWKLHLSVLQEDGLSPGTAGLRKHFRQLMNQAERYHARRSADTVTLDPALSAMVLADFEGAPLFRSSFFLLMAILLIEKHTKNSFWEPYLTSLPTTPGFLDTLPPADTAVVSGSTCFAVRIGQLKNYIEFVPRFLELVLARHRDRLPRPYEQVFSASEVRWAFHTCAARAVWYGSARVAALVPGLDSVKSDCSRGHSIDLDTPSTVRSTTCAVRGADHVKPCIGGDTSFTLAAKEDLQPGGTLHQCMGGESNIDLLINRGYIVRNNPLPSSCQLIITISDSDPTMQLIKTKLLKTAHEDIVHSAAALEDYHPHSILDSVTQVVLSVNDTALTPRLLLFTRVATTPAPHYASVHDLVYGTTNSTDPREEIDSSAFASLENEHYSLQQLQQAFSGFKSNTEALVTKKASLLRECVTVKDDAKVCRKFREQMFAVLEEEVAVWTHQVSLIKQRWMDLLESETERIFDRTHA